MGKTEILYEKIPAVRLENISAARLENIQKKKVRFENVYICSEWKNGENG